MKDFYLIKKLNKIVKTKSSEEIVTRMREYEWNNKSDNRDYMHVYAYWRNKNNSNVFIRFENEKDFVEDLFRLNQIEKVSFWDYLADSIFGKTKNINLNAH